jgi:hypothetical protein
LISCPRHRHFGALVTTSFSNPQVYDEVRSDPHLMALISGGTNYRPAKGP